MDLCFINFLLFFFVFLVFFAILRPFPVISPDLLQIMGLTGLRKEKPVKAAGYSAVNVLM